MKRIRAAWLLGMLAVSGVLSCASPEEPALPDGRIVLRFESGRAAASTVADAAAAARAAARFDSVVVRVFRSGTPLVEETSKGVGFTGDPVDVAIACFAENHKRVSVELFDSTRTMTYHGANPDVNVLAGQQNAVNVDVYEFTVDTLQVSPRSVSDGESFTLGWSPAAAAAWYQVQSSPTPAFATIEWQQTVTDTLLDHQSPPGAHYFRVIPRTQFARGTAEGPEFAYVSGASKNVSVTGFDPPRVIPGDRFTIVGENLDYPGTTARIGFDNLPIVRASWDSLVVTLPSSATTNTVTVTSGNLAFGTDTSDSPLVALRVAYVTLKGEYATQYVAAMESHSKYFGYSGVAVIPVEDLGRRDMNAFDIIVVANDTGTSALNWGGDPNRANAIADSRAHVIAIGKGGAVFLALLGVTDAQQNSVYDGDRLYFMKDTGASVFNDPYQVNGPEFAFCTATPTTVALNITTAPPGVNLYAATGKACNIFLQCFPNDLWALADFGFENRFGQPLVYFFWGYSGSPSNLTTDGSNVLGNVMYMLYQNP